MRLLLCALVALSTLGCLASPANADDWTDCKLSVPERRIAACTRIINRRDEGPTSIALAYTYRGNAYRSREDNERAIADFTKAIELDPTTRHITRVSYTRPRMSRTWPSPRIQRQYGSIPATRSPTTAVAIPMPPRVSASLPSPISTKQSAWTRNFPSPTPIDAPHIVTRPTWSAQSPTAIRPSNSSPTIPTPTAAEATSIGRKSDYDAGLRRFQQGNQS